MREGEGEAFLVVINFLPTPAELDVPRGTVAVASSRSLEGRELAGPATLEGDAAMVLWLAGSPG